MFKCCPTKFLQAKPREQWAVSLTEKKSPGRNECLERVDRKRICNNLPRTEKMLLLFDQQSVRLRYRRKTYQLRKRRAQKHHRRNPKQKERAALPNNLLQFQKREIILSSRTKMYPLHRKRFLPLPKRTCRHQRRQNFKVSGEAEARADLLCER